MRRNRYFQWLDGDLKGTVSVLENITCEEGEYFYNFTDGETCNLRFISQMTNSSAALKGKVMVEVANPNDLWTAEEVKVERRTYMDPNAGEQTVDVPPLEDIAGQGTTINGQNLSVEHSAIGTTKFKAPRYKGPFSELPSLDDYLYDENVIIEEPHITSPTVQTIEQSSLPISPNVEISASIHTPAVDSFTSGLAENDPVRLLAKTCKKHSTPVEMTININLPSKSIYTIANDEFEDGGKKFIECLVETITVEDIKYAIRDALIAAYSESGAEINQ